MDLFQHAADRLAMTGGVPTTAQRHFADAAQSRQRRSQLVRRVRREPPQTLEALLQPSECIVEHGGKPAELVVWILNGQPFVKPIGGDFPGPSGHRADRSQHVAGEHVSTQDRQRQYKR